jgi:hypothetical protein
MSNAGVWYSVREEKEEVFDMSITKIVKKMEGFAY